MKYVFLPAAQFAESKGLGWTDALLTTSHHLQKTLDAGMESYNVQLDFSGAFDRVSRSCPFVENSSPTAGRELWLMVLSVYGSQSYQVWHREMC